MTTVTAVAESDSVRELLPAATIADLQSRDAPDETKTCQVLGYAAEGDGGAATFYWNAASTATDNSTAGIGLVTTILPTGHIGAGRWKVLSEPAATGIATSTGTVAISTTAPTAGQVLTASSGTAASWRDDTRPIGMACSDLTTALTTGTNKAVIRAPFAMTLTGVRASLATAQTSGSIFTVDINESGVSILSTKLTIDNAEKTSTTAATAAVISDASIANDAEIGVDIDQVGDGTAKGLVVWLLGYPT